MKNASTFVICILLSSILFAQGPPPTMAMPTDNNTILINEIIEVTNQEQYFIEYCAIKVREYAADNNWSTEKTNQILESIELKHYVSTIYNNYSGYSSDELKAILTTMTLINEGKGRNSKIILINPMMHNNLDLFLEGLLEGKYVTRK